MDVGAKGQRFPGLPWILRKFNNKLFNALLIAGADPKLRDYEGQTVLFQRIKSGPPNKTELIDLCEKMTKVGARIDTVDFKSQNLFDASLSSGFPRHDIFRVLSRSWSRSEAERLRWQHSLAQGGASSHQSQV
jgi:hypothetical protein